ncbi:MAG TPA: hypothetical protein VN153_11100 [Tahibacter sp.]|nr:hypothetical protein [Tahibacter sp.]
MENAIFSIVMNRRNDVVAAVRACLLPGARAATARFPDVAIERCGFRPGKRDFRRFRDDADQTVPARSCRQRGGLSVRQRICGFDPAAPTS